MDCCESIFNAAEKYDVVHLLDALFVRFVKFHKIAMDNVADLLFFANANNLPRLNKLAVDFIQGNKEKFGKLKLSTSWKCDSCPETFGSFNDLNIHEIKCKSSQEGNGLPAPLVATGDAHASVPLAAAAALVASSVPSSAYGGAPSPVTTPFGAPAPAPAGGLFGEGVRAPAPTSAYGGAQAPATSGFGAPAPGAPVPAPASAHGAAPAPAFGASPPALQFGPAPPAPAGGPR